MLNIKKKIILIALILAVSTINANVVFNLFSTDQRVTCAEIVQVALGEESANGNQNGNGNHNGNGNANHNGNSNHNHNGSITTSNPPTKSTRNLKVIISE